METVDAAALTRRAFLAGAAGTASAIAAPAVPSYLKGYEKLYANDPRAAALAWFRDAKFGLFIHYGLYSLEGRHEWLMFREKIRPIEYAKLAQRFTAEKFDAGAICDLALEAGMR
jgi:alpha-L-fucosidase